MDITTAEHFAKYGWAYVPNLADKYECDMLTSHLLSLKEEGKLKTDKQCPLSVGIYGEPLLDKFLDLNKSKISSLIDIPIIPTYTYARVYSQNDELKIHKDRPSCEISVTMTLGHDKNSEIWPIYFSKNNTEKDTIKKIIKIGDGVIYRGMDIWHWRRPYKGKWQAQVFLHYVDANGPNKDQAFDGRDKLGTKLRIKNIRE